MGGVPSSTFHTGVFQGLALFLLLLLVTLSSVIVLNAFCSDLIQRHSFKCHLYIESEFPAQLHTFTSDSMCHFHFDV
jgi:hypothetical protein